ncbi:MAG: YihY/virulence factor BrkB family protein [Pseudomonadota bacterium]
MLSLIRTRAIQFGTVVMSMAAPAIVIHSIQRMMAREVMLFAGGASFFALLALFPALAAGAAIYGLLVSPDAAASQMTRIADTGVVPPTAQSFLSTQVSQLAGAPAASLTLQGAVALLISVFAAARGAKAVIAGLNQIARRGDLRNVLHFNLLAMGAVMAGGALLIASNLLVFAVPNVIRPIARLFGVEGLDYSLIFNEWTTAALAMGTALYLLYRYLMQRAGETSWRASLVGAASATALWLAGSKGFSLYVTAVIHPTAYGSLGALIVFLLWVYWSSYAVFFGGSLAVEVDNWRAGKRAVDEDRGSDSEAARPKRGGQGKDAA